MEQTKVEVKFGDWIQGGFNLWKDNLGVLIVASLIAMILSAITLGILAGPMTAGLIMITLKLVDKKEPKPKAGDVFDGFQVFLPSFLFILVWGVALTIVYTILMLIICVGWILLFALELAIIPLFMFALYLIAEKKMDFWTASKESINIGKANFFPLLALGLVAGIISSIGAIACGIGVIITMPIGVCIIAIAYREMISPLGGTTPVTTPVAPTTTV